jgi:hypothetical protein
LSVPVLSWLLIVTEKSELISTHLRYETSVFPHNSWEKQERPSFEASLWRPHYPILRANPFPEVTDLFCRLPLSTFFYWLEAFYLGNLMRLWVRTTKKIRIHIGFSSSHSNTPDIFKTKMFSHMNNPYRRLIRFQGSVNVKKKRELFPGRLQLSPTGLMLPYDILCWCRNFNLLTFRALCFRRNTSLPVFTVPLGSTYPCPIAVHMEPFSTSVFKVLIWIFATTTKICTEVSSRLTQANPSKLTTRPPTYLDFVR